jgi:hypothetical protein
MANLELPFGIKVLGQKPLDSKYLNDGVPYTSIAQANTILVSGVRSIGLTVNINFVDFHYKDDITDQGLVIKTVDISNKADLVNGLVPQSQLPSYVDDVLEFANQSSFPATGETGKIYIANSPDNLQYRWSGSSYIQITNGLIASTDDIVEGSNNLFFSRPRVLATPLVGFSLLVATAVTVSDTIIIAFGKFQKQINDIKTALGDRLGITGQTLGYRIIEPNFDFLNIPANYANSIWEIRNYHDLSSASITIPANVTLKFVGGRFENLEIIANRTKIDASLNTIFKGLVLLSGVWDVVEIYPQWFGAVGDGVTDDFLPISKALNTKIPVNGLEFTYKINSDIAIYDQSILINKLKLLYSNTGGTALKFGGAAVVVSGLVTSSGVGSNIINQNTKDAILPNVTGIVKGSLVTITSDTLWYYDNRGTAFKGETKIVRSVSGSTVEFDSEFQDTYDLNSEDLTYVVYNPTEIKINNLSLINQVTGNEVGITIQKTVEPVLNNVYVKGFGITGLNFSAVYGGIVFNPLVEDCFVLDNGLSYGLITSSTTGLKILSGSFRRNRRAIDFSGGTPTRRCLVDNCYTTGVVVAGSSSNDSSGMGTHGAADNNVFSNNYITNSTLGIIIRGRNTTVKNNKFGRILTSCISHIAGQGVAAYGNEMLTVTGTLGLANASFFYVFNGPAEDYPTLHLPIVIKGNIINTNRVVLDFPAATMSYVNITENNVNIYSLSPSNDCLMVRGPVAINYCTIQNNIFRVHRGNDLYIDRAVTSIGNQTDVERINLLASDIVATGLTGTSVDGYFRVVSGVIEFSFKLVFTTTVATTLNFQLPINTGPDSAIAQGNCYIGGGYDKLLSFYNFTNTGLLLLSPNNVSRSATFAASTTFTVFVNGTHKSRYKY